MEDIYFEKLKKNVILSNAIYNNYIKYFFSGADKDGEVLSDLEQNENYKKYGLGFEKYFLRDGFISNIFFNSFRYHYLSKEEN
jgi:hypothetical protein